LVATELLELSQVCVLLALRQPQLKKKINIKRLAAAATRKKSEEVEKDFDLRLPHSNKISTKHVAILR